MPQFANDRSQPVRLLRDFLPKGDTILRLVRGGQGRASYDLDMKPKLSKLLEELVPPIRLIYERRRRLGDITAAERQGLLAPLELVAGIPIDTLELSREVGRVADMIRGIMKMVPTDYHHQVTDDGRSHLDDPLGHLLMACYPQTEFRVPVGQIPFNMAQDERLNSIRSYNAFATLIIAAWLLGRRQALDQRGISIEQVTAYLEQSLYKTPKKVNDAWLKGDRVVAPIYSEFDPDAGFAFRSLRESRQGDVEQHVSRHSMPRYILSDDGKRYIQVLMWARRKRVDLLKHLWIRRIDDSVGFRIVFRNEQDYLACRVRLQREVLQFGKAKVVAGRRVVEDTNRFSRQHPGTLWQGSVSIGDNDVELQVLTYDAWWLWCMSFLSGSHAAYKWRQWMLPGDLCVGDECRSVPPAFELLAPPSIYVGWDSWEFKVKALERALLLHAASEYGIDHLGHVQHALRQITSYLLQNPLEGTYPDSIFTASR